MMAPASQSKEAISFGPFSLLASERRLGSFALTTLRQPSD